MASTNFIARQTVIEADWLNDVDKFVYEDGVTSDQLALPGAAAGIGWIQAGLGAIKRWVQDKLRAVELSTKDFDTLAEAIAAAPVGSTIRIEGECEVTTPLVITKRINMVCKGADDYLLINVGAGNDGVKFQGDAAGLNGINVDINVYGRANACRDAVIFERVDRSTLRVNVRAGASRYGTVLRGVLINRIEIQSTVNYAPPISSPGLQVDHVSMEVITLTVSGSPADFGCNANEMFVNLEGARHGITGADMGGQGNNHIYGTIEGLSGRPFDMDKTIGLDISDLHLEVNGQAGLIDGAINPKLGAGVVNLASPPLILSNCRGATIDGYTGKLTVEASCIGTKLGRVVAYERGDFVCLDPSTEGSGVCLVSSTTVIDGGPGEPPISNIFHNPYMDIWTAGTTSAPDGTTLTNATVARSTAITFPGNPSAVCAAVAVTGTTIVDGIDLGVKEQPARASDWVSFMLPVYVATGQPDLRIYMFDGAAYNYIADVTTKDAWVVVRGAAKTIAGQSWYVAARVFNGTAFVAGNFLVGGLSVSKGASAHKYLSDDGQRTGHIVTSVSNAPAFVGQRAYLSGTGKWYMAAGVSSSADWIILN